MPLIRVIAFIDRSMPLQTLPFRTGPTMSWGSNVGRSGWQILGTLALNIGDWNILRRTQCWARANSMEVVGAAQVEKHQGYDLQLLFEIHRSMRLWAHAKGFVCRHAVEFS